MQEQERREKLQLEKEKLQIDEQEWKEKLEMEKALKQQEIEANLKMQVKERHGRLAFKKEKKNESDSNFDMIIIHIGILTYPVKDSAEKYSFLKMHFCLLLLFILFGIPNKLRKT